MWSPIEHDPRRQIHAFGRVIQPEGVHDEDTEVMVKPINCPNCGAALHGGVCAYCDTETLPTPVDEKSFLNFSD